MNLETLIRQAKPDYIHADSEKVASAILERLHELPKPKRRKVSMRIAVIAAAVVAMMLSALTVNAATGGKLFGAILLNKENRHIAKEPNYVAMQEVPAGTKIPPDKRPIPNSNIINKDLLQTVNASSVTNVAIAENNGNSEIPELLLKYNGDLVIFTKKGESGWHLNKGEELTIQYKLDLKTSEYSDPAGEWMEIGYIKNGELITSYTKKAMEFSNTITADEAGEYYFYAENFSAGSIIITSGMIK
ncbi:hypothetical protein ACFPES_03865 [Paenibacillus sp. GCM10023248]|uniref:hypothetical protein n=1 Tax=unclassified Paenibacillus TaxID=185978 RepID=UPI002377FB05|nr:hypothetical protein [Paenibacillus sp. MAHUQ-63]MDD9266164.1 hypothetical protein [Paenibacillus sp. MAHUQ-63]